MEPISDRPIISKKHSSWNTFWLGLGVCGVGGLMIVLGDGDDGWIGKAVVVFGVTLSIAGIAILRYMLLSKPLSKMFTRKTM